jgi:hypothetical protein
VLIPAKLPRIILTLIAKNVFQSADRHFFGKGVKWIEDVNGLTRAQPRVCYSVYAWREPVRVHRFSDDELSRGVEHTDFDLSQAQSVNTAVCNREIEIEQLSAVTMFDQRN